MFSFGYPHMLVLLAIIPVLFGLFVWSRKAREKKLKKFGQLSVLSQLMPDVSRYTPWIKIGLELVLILVIVVMLARPRAKTGVTSSNMKVQGSEVVIALDISNSMRASSTDDVDGISRLQQSKFLVQKLFDRLRNDKVGFQAARVTMRSSHGNNSHITQLRNSENIVISSWPQGLGLRDR